MSGPWAIADDGGCAGGEDEKIVAFGRMNVRPHEGKNSAAETFAVYTKARREAVVAQPISALLCKGLSFLSGQRLHGCNLSFDI